MVVLIALLAPANPFGYVKTNEAPGPAEAETVTVAVEAAEPPAPVQVSV